MSAPVQVTESDVILTSGRENLPAFFALPERSTTVPGAVMVHDIFGLRDLARDQARRLASQGVAALYPHLLRGTGPFDPANNPNAGKESQPFVKAITVDQCMADLCAGLAFLRSRPEVDSQRLMIWGYCWGGAMVLRGAGRIPGLAAVVVWHGMLEGDELAEIDRARLTGFSEEQQTKVASLMRSYANKLLHGPVTRLKEAADAGDGMLHVHAMRYLFGLGGEGAPRRGGRGSEGRPEGVGDPEAGGGAERESSKS